MSVTSAGTGRELTLSVTGEVDHHAAGEIMAELERQMEERLPRKLTLDLGGVTFMDSSGIAVVLRAHRRVGELGGSLTVRDVPVQAAKVLRAAGLERMVRFE
ncbi:Stage II sporulation protein (fragment) [uncultured Eubacteriales bacterium]|uniref:Anti-sigma factor antagonist n=1 Tax=uncultured Eubacteriales bacterium TaxID=172733 RepID=A0A212K5E9_9FIRM